MKKQCYMVSIYLNGVLFVGGLILFLVMGYYIMAAVWLIGVHLFQWLYLRAFPSISPLIGYGRVTDRPADAVSGAQAKVVLYTALGCPFCPILKRRLLVLQEEMGFELEEVDVTLKPDILRGKGINAVPVVEVREQRLVGHATSQELAALIQSTVVPR